MPIVGTLASSETSRTDGPTRVLVTDGSSLSARQAITALGRSGAVIDVVDPASRPLARFSRFVRLVHKVPSYGRDPWGWFDATLRVLASGDYDVLLAVHEQTAVLARAADRVRDMGVGLAVPPFSALRKVQDKAAAIETLELVGLAHPPTTLASHADDVLGLAGELPVYLKARIGTASGSVFHATDAAGLNAATAQLRRQRAFEYGGVLVQHPVQGPLLMIQAVFDSGVLIAHHANLRLREGASGGASHKRSVELPVIQHDLARLGHALNWHGALSLDAILSGDRPWYIDVNPRLVEPANAERAGVDLVGRLVDLALGRPARPSSPGRAGVATHQLLLAILGAAQRGGGRRGVASELVQAALHRGHYTDSREELTPVTDDPDSALPLAAMATSLLIQPERYRWFTTGAITSYALTAAAWRQICGHDDAPSSRRESPGDPAPTAVAGGRSL